jgi:2-polyprenyl-6-hydroxyphenyl methylase/3-demethylubiquinone-9 3-methyltransferase
MLELDSLEGKRFLDAGSGSGLFSLAARRLGATVYSFDFDPQSVQCTRELQRRYYAGDSAWVVAEGSVLDPGYLGTLGTFDIVYSWGVLHHTGAMWQALENIQALVASGGKLFIAIYNDQGPQSQRWHTLKRVYNKLPSMLRPLFSAATLGPRELRFLTAATVKGRPWSYFESRLHYTQHSTRGMSYYHDLIDWIGGYPFEVATPEQIFDFFRQRNYVLARLATCGGGLGCNQFVFDKNR